MSLAAVVLAHRGPEQVGRLLDRLAPAPAFLHVDLAVDPVVHRRFLAAAAPTRTALVPRRRSGWASWGIVAAVLEGMAAAVRRPDWTHLAVLSGQDYPLAPPKALAAFLAERPGTSFMPRWPLPRPEIWGPDGGMRRLRYRHWIVRGRHVVLPVARPLPRGVRPWGGSMHACLARPAVEAVLHWARTRPDVVRFYRRSWIPDEMFVPTVVMNSPARETVANESLWFIRWSDRGGRHPDVLRESDLPDLARAASGPSDVGGHGPRKLFARKLDAEADERLLDLIDAELLGR